MSRSMKYERWSDEEINLLKDGYEETPREELVEIFDRPWGGIKNKASTIGVSKIKNHSEVDSFLSSHGQPWSSDETRLLTEIYENTPKSELVEIFSRTWDSIRTKASEVKVSKINTASSVDLSPSESLSYILGVILGDGYVYVNPEKPRYMIGLNVIDRSFCEYFSSNLDNIGLNSSIYKKDRDDCKQGFVFSLECHSKRFTDWYADEGIDDIFEVVSESDEFLYEFLAGLYDSEGSINYRSSNGTVQNVRLTTTDEQMKNLFVDVFDCLGMDSFVYEYEDDDGYTEHGWVVGVSNKSGVKKFFRNIESSIRRKNPNEGTLEYARDEGVSL